MRFTQALARFALVSSGALLASGALAQQPPLIAENAWVRAIPGADTAAAYLTLRNETARAVTVVSVESPVAGHAMIHESTTEGGQSRMRPREPLTIAPRSTLKLEPGGLHIMLHDLKQPLTAGASVPLTLRVTGGSVVQVTAAVRPLSAE